MKVKIPSIIYNRLSVEDKAKTTILLEEIFSSLQTLESQEVFLMTLYSTCYDMMTVEDFDLYDNFKRKFDNIQLDRLIFPIKGNSDA